MQTDFRTWLFASPRRLVVVSLTAIILIFVAGSTLFGNDGASGSSSDPAGSAPAAVSTSASVPESSAYVGTAVNFVKLWAELGPGETKQQWLAKLTPLSTQDYARALSTTDTASLPGVPPTGEPSVRFLADDSAMIAVPLSNASSVLVTVVSGEGTADPVVSDVQPNTGDN